MFYVSVPPFTRPSLPPSSVPKSSLQPSRFKSAFLRSEVALLVFLAAMASTQASDLAQEKEEKASASQTGVQGTLDAQHPLLRT